jgi:hypothetical protein
MKPEPPFVTPCPEPAGGWVPADPARSGERSLRELQRKAQKRDDFALSWIDQSHGRIVNVQVTGDAAAADADLRTVWGGSLCVTQVEHTEKELLGIQQETADLPGFQGSSGITIENRGELSVTYDEGSHQRWIDATYGAGTVVVTSLLTPVGQPAPTSG